MSRWNRPILLALICTTAVVSCSKTPEKAAVAPVQPSLLVSVHFVGSEKAAALPGGTRLKSALGIPSARAVVDQTARQLSQAPDLLLPGTTSGKGKSDTSPLIRPLVDDLLKHESVFELRGGEGLPSEWGLAIRLPADRMALWQTNLSIVARGWDGVSVQTNGVAGFAGVAFRRSALSNTLGVVRAGDWLLAGFGPDALPSMAGLAGRIAQGKTAVRHAGTNWLELEADFPRLARVWPKLGAYSLPQVSLAFVGRGQNIRVEGNVGVAEPFFAQLPEWQVPKDAIREPLVSLTAARGIATWLSRFAAVRELGVDPLPNQAYVWSQSDVPFQTFVGFQLPNPTNTLQQISRKIPELIKSSALEGAMGTIRWNPSRSEILWENLPFVVPFLRSAMTPQGPFLMAGIFPTAAQNPTVPEELLNQFLPRKDLAYFSWEVTQARIVHFRSISQLTYIVQNLPLPPKNAANAWFDALLQPDKTAKAADSLTSWPNTVTELAVTSPQTAKLTRSGPLGLSAAELVALGEWLDDPAFPSSSPRPVPPKAPANARPAGAK